ncbi:uncharacterized protein LOC106636480 [Copidosoma floridanum]|uniref:uncharacterized protein LOC106636480 n=1 Tax=Copidosoma floridanum TaxID=29053 RepID=UPI0006C99B9B|nr:uncharacterized protein LOC106636480 [Copidosoma floridanum]
MKNSRLTILTLFFAAIHLNFSTTLVRCEAPRNATGSSESVAESHVEHVQVERKTGFDGQVRSIRFGIDGSASKAQEINADATESVVVAVSSSGDKDPSAAMPDVPPMEPATTDLGDILELDKSAATKAPIVRRSVGKGASGRNELDDLEAEEAKVFRPLFVYRSQVAKRLKTRNGKSAGTGVRRSNRPHRYFIHRY